MITNHGIMNYQSHWRESQNISTSYSSTPYLNGGTITFKWVTLKLLIFFRFGSTEAYSKWIHYQFMTLVSSFLAHQNKRKGWNPRYKKVACNMLRYYFWSMESYDYPQYKCHRAAYHSSKIRAFLTNVWLKIGCCLQMELSHVTEWQIEGIEGVFRVPSTF